MTIPTSAEPIRTVGFIGLGRMGSGMAQNILRAGFALRVYNRTVAKLAPCLDQGAVAAASPREAALGADAVITSLMDDRSVLDAVTGNDGILAGLAADGIHIGTTTISPACASQLAALHAAHRSHYIAAPVLGRPDAAAAGTLRTFVAGDPTAIARCTPLIEAYAQAPVNLGTEHRVANSMKLAANYIIASLIELMGEVYAFAERSGIEAEMMNLLLATLLGAPGVKDYATRIRDREFEPAGFALSAGLKDVELMLAASTEVRVALPYANVIREKLLAAIANGMEHKDWSAVYEITRMNAGLP